MKKTFHKTEDRRAIAIKTTKRLKKRTGQADYIKFLKGERITRNQAIRAKAFECIGDGDSCGVITCALFNFCQFSDNPEKEVSGEFEETEDGNGDDCP